MLRRKQVVDGQVGLSQNHDGISVVSVRNAQSAAPAVVRCELSPLPGGEDESMAIRLLFSRLGLDKHRCNWVLGNNEYDLLLTEAPDVQADELREAIRWQVRDLIDIDIEDAAIDVFEVPRQIHMHNERLMYAVAAHSSVVSRIVRLMDRSGADLNAIDVTELALRNIADRLPAASGGCTMLYLSEHNGLILVFGDQQLYLARRLSVGWQSLGEDEAGANSARALDTIAAEIERSLSYCDSRFGFMPAPLLRLTPMPEPAVSALQPLADKLRTRVQRIDLNTMLDPATPLSPGQQQHGLLALGAALRRETRTL